MDNELNFLYEGREGGKAPCYVAEWFKRKNGRIQISHLTKRFKNPFPFSNRQGEAGAGYKFRIRKDC